MKWLCVDPGEETGWSIWDGMELIQPGQDKLWEFIDRVDLTLSSDPGYGARWEDLAVEEFGAIVCEDWQLYPWVVKDGSLDFDKCRTARGIGALELLARQHGIPIFLQPATIKEAAEAAGANELFVTPLHENRHMNDSIMHGVFYTAKNGSAPC